MREEVCQALHGIEGVMLTRARKEFSRVTVAACGLPTAAITTISPSMSWTLSRGVRIPASAMRWYSWTLNRRFVIVAGISDLSSMQATS